MRRKRTADRWVPVILFVGVALLSGCSKKIVISRVPAFWTPDIHTIAVIPFRSAVRNRRAGEIVSDQLAALLANNQAYKRVYNRNDYRNLVDETRLRSSWSDNPDAIVPFRRWGKAQYVLVGTVTQYSATYRNTPKQEPIYRYNRYTKQMDIIGYRKYIHTRNEANVAANATLIRVADGQQVYSSGPVTGMAWAETGYGGSAPPMDPHGCLVAATNQVVSRLLMHFGIVPMEVKVNPSKDFLIASGPPYDNKWPVVNKCRMTDEQLYVVLRLPSACDRNRFRITITRKGLRKDLAKLDFVWRASYPSAGKSFSFSPKQVAKDGGGPGTYLAKFYAGPEPAMVREFEIVP